MKLPNQMKYQMEKKGMNSLKKRTMKKKGKQMKAAEGMHEMPDGSMMKNSMMKMKKMKKGGKC